ncbi:hypothetical protein CsSME_00031458 [Camellia sinensis var. sinensis]
MWSLVQGGILTNDTLQKRRPNRSLNPQRCIMCCKDGESLDHLFLHYPVVLSLWHRLFVLRNVMWLAPKGSVHMLLIDFYVWEDRKRPKCFGLYHLCNFWVL